ncbi:MAG: tRNA pseudouridine(13) synthase TruD [Gammaproteobacteria bacterium]|nr:tRNA pseudouridine(13) synthase TruD [Gammaproteobacteria bacterium]
MSHLLQLHYVLGQPEVSAAIRQSPEDFRVSEQLSFDPAGEGQHVYLFIEKCDLNTEDLANQLAGFAHVPRVAVGYAGLKDRHAVTRQWFSVDLAGKSEPDWRGLDTDNIEVIETIRHTRKLKRGAIRGNWFQITLSQFSGDPEDLTRRLEYINQHGVPNYFGEQRFGRNDANLKQAEKLIKDESKRVKRHQRGLYLSAVRSYLFNLVLSQRTADHTWNQAIPGDVMMLEGSHSVFKAGVIDDVIVQRVTALDIHPTGPLWGAGGLMTTDDALAVETHIMQSQQAWCELLVSAGLKQERRALRIKVSDLRWEWRGTDVVLEFQLPAGGYATAVLRELVIVSNC